MFIVVELPELDLKAVTAALDSDRCPSATNTAVPLLNMAKADLFGNGAESVKVTITHMFTLAR